MECPNDTYSYNPYSNTCIRLVDWTISYADAKANCESVGEYMATFETAESAYWLNNMRRTGTL